MNAALDAPLQGRAYAAPARASQSPADQDPHCTQCCAVVAPGIEAVLHLALVVEGVEGPVTERGDDHDGDDGGDIAAPARMRLFILVVRTRIGSRGAARGEALDIPERRDRLGDDALGVEPGGGVHALGLVVILELVRQRHRADLEPAARARPRR